MSRCSPLRLPPLLVLVALVLLAACTSGSGGASTTATPSAPSAASNSTSVSTAAVATFPFTFKGGDGADVTVAKAPRRIVSLSAGGTETLFAIGAGGQLVAVDRFSDFPAETARLPKVEYTKPSIESLAAQQPDLILASGRQKDVIPAMQAAGLPVALLEEPVNVKAVIERVRLLGRVTGHVEEAERVATGMDARIRTVQEKLSSVAAGGGPRVYHELSGQFFTAAPASFVGDLYTILKARNIAEGSATAFPQLSQEVIVARDPEAIVLADGREGVTVADVKGRSGWSSIAAVQSGRVYLLTDDEANWTSRPGPRVVDGLERLAKLLYPERF